MIKKRFEKLLPAHSFRFVFSLMYLGVIITIVCFNLVGSCHTQFFSWQTGVLLLVFAGLVGLDYAERSRYQYDVPLPAALFFLLVRIALIQIGVGIDCSWYAAFLYPLIPFTAYFSLGSRVSNVVALGYVVLYFWQYRPLNGLADDSLFNLMIFVVLMLFMLILSRVIDSDEWNQKNLEMLLEDLEASNVKLQLYAEQVADLAATEERNRLARDIHDSLGHRLTVVNIQLEKALAYKDRNPVEAEQALVDAKQAASAALKDVRRSVGSLRDAEDGFLLRVALAELVEGMQNGRFSITYAFTGEEENYARSVLMALYRSAQEGLTNVQKHAQATQVKLAVHLEESEGKLILQDNGLGFDTTKLDDLAIDQYHSFGLQGIQERLELVRGQMQVVSQPEKGTILQITVPRNPMVLAAVERDG
jgi:signal transduction histidine kinase